MDKTFSDEVKKAVCEAQNGFCRTRECLEKIHSFHHKLKNTAANREKHPLLIHSVLNCAGLCLDCHTNKDYLHRITEKESEIYERYLEKLKSAELEEEKG